MFFSSKEKRKLAKHSDSRGKIISSRRPPDSIGGKVSRILYWAIFFIFVGVVGFAILFSGFLSITSIVVNGAATLDPEKIKTEIKSGLEGKYVRLIPKNNLILVRKDKLKKKLLEKFKIIEELEISKNFPDTLEIKLTEKQAVMIFCSQSVCFVIDEKGIAQNQSDFEAAGLQESSLVSLTDASGKQLSAGEEALKVELMDFIIGAREKLKSELSLNTSQNIETPRLSSRDIFFTTDGGWKIYLNQDIGVDKEIEMLKVVLADKISQGERNNLEYIDLRTENKVYYKFKNIEQKTGN